MIPTFANIRLAIKNGKRKSKTVSLIMETEMQSKHNQKKIKKKLHSINITLISSLSIICYNYIIHQINIASNKKLLQSTILENLINFAEAHQLLLMRR